MPRQLFGESPQRLLSADRDKPVSLSRPQIEMLRQKRTPKYVDAMKTLDAGGPLVVSSLLQELRDAISEQFPEGVGVWPRGWVAACYLGPAFEVHILDIAGEIVRHFHYGEPMPDPLERARSLAANRRYAFVEVHADKLVAVRHDGSTSVTEL
jgi:hypothetical protein